MTLSSKFDILLLLIKNGGRMKLSEELQWRGFVSQTTFSDISILDKEPLSFYWGVDPSSDSMTVGNLAAAMMVRHFIDHGHKPFLLVGGATGLIGDPDGKSSARMTKTIETIAKNKNGIAAQYNQVFAGKNFTLVDNYDWFKNMNYLDFLTEIGMNVPMSQMLDREFVKSRLSADGAGLSYAEFSYSLIQAYDFLYLSRKFGVSLQVCGADQWGNCVAGVDLIRRLDGKESNVYSIPLVMNKSTGKKFGKSEDGAVWLDSAKTSVYKFYQFWLNCDDEGVIDYLKIYTLFSKDDIDKLEQQTKTNPSERAAQKALAAAVTEIVHGKQRTDSVIKVTSVLFGGVSVDSLSSDELDMLAAEIPTSAVGKSVVEILIETGVATGTGDAKRLITAGAITIDGQKVGSDMAIENLCLVKKGKNNFVLVR